MTKEFIKNVPYVRLEQAYSAYNTLMCIYEDVCGGPYGAMKYKEYFAIRDSRDNIRTEVVNRSNS